MRWDWTDPDRLYIGLVREEMGSIAYFALMVTDDGGMTWTQTFERDGEISAFALSPDGSQVIIGGPDDGLLVADTSDMAFAQISDIHARCATWDSSGIYVCADQFKDGYNVALSTDGGSTFTPLSEQSSPCGPPEMCGADSSIGTACPSRWPEEQAELGAPESCTDGAGGSGMPTDAGDGGGCGCRIAGDRQAPALPTWLFVTALSMAVIRRR